MTRPNSPKKPQIEQDSFDRATIKVIYELQKLGFCKSIAQVENYLQLGPRKLQQVLYGERHVSKTHRGKLLQFFTNNYHVNPRIFTNVSEEVFKGEPPTLEEQPEKYFTKNDGNMLNMGDFVKMERLQKELSDCLKDRKEKDKEIKYLRGLLEVAVRKPEAKTDKKTDKAKKAKR